MGWLLFQGVFLVGMVGEQALCLLQEEVGFHEGFVADILPEDAALWVDEECPVEGGVFVIVISAVLLEDFEGVIGNDFDGVLLGLFIEGFDGVDEVGGFVRTDGDKLNAGVFEGLLLGGEGGELLNAMQATGAKIENDDNGFAAVVFE